MQELARLLGAVALLGVASGACQAQTLRVTPATVDRAIANAQPGQTIVLEGASYPRLMIQGRRFNRPVTIDARAARINGITMRNVEGMVLNGGTIVTSSTEEHAVVIDYSRDVEVHEARVSGARIGIGVARSRDIRLIDNDLDGLRSDGINIAMSQSVVITGNHCHNLNPIMPVYSPTGTLLQDGDHPDCIQGWSAPGYPLTADITITGNRGEGYMQGVFFGNAGGPLDRMIVKNNEFALAAWNGIVLYTARDSEVSNNIVRTIPGAKMLNYPFGRITSWIRTFDGARNKICGNKVDYPHVSDGTAPCR